MTTVNTSHESVESYAVDLDHDGRQVGAAMLRQLRSERDAASRHEGAFVITVKLLEARVESADRRSHDLQVLNSNLHLENQRLRTLLRAKGIDPLEAV